MIVVTGLRQHFARTEPNVPVLVGGAPGRGGHYVWPQGRVIHDQVFPTGSLFYCEGDCRTCPKCGTGNSTIAAQCQSCHTLLPWKEKS